MAHLKYVHLHSSQDDNNGIQVLKTPVSSMAFFTSIYIIEKCNYLILDTEHLAEPVISDQLSSVQL